MTRSFEANAVDLLATSTACTSAFDALAGDSRRWLVTGGAGFIGSHLTETLLLLGQEVVVLDDLSTGSSSNLDEVRTSVGSAAAHLRFVEGDIRDAAAVAEAAKGAAVVLHHAAAVSVPGSIDDPVTSHDINVTGFLNVLQAARASGARVVYAASSASYGDDPADVKVEDRLGRPLSLYAASKTANELYAAAFQAAYGLESVGLRYFNVFGPRQDPRGAYAAVIPAWIDAMQRGDRCHVYGDGLQTRDFCHVANVVGANLLAATTTTPAAIGSVFNAGTGERTTLLELHDAIVEAMAEAQPERSGLVSAAPVLDPPRPGDVRHSCADVERARAILGFEPVVGLRQGIRHTLSWFLAAA